MTHEDQAILDHWQSQATQEDCERTIHELDGCIDRLREIAWRRGGLKHMEAEGERLRDINEKLMELLMQISASKAIIIESRESDSFVREAAE